MTTLDMPPALSTRVLNALKADPRTVDLRAQAPHFYNLGARMLDLFEEDEIAEVLINVRPSWRIRRVRDQSLSRFSADVSLGRHSSGVQPTLRTTLTILGVDSEREWSS